MSTENALYRHCVSQPMCSGQSAANELGKQGKPVLGRRKELRFLPYAFGAVASELHYVVQYNIGRIW